MPARINRLHRDQDKLFACHHRLHCPGYPASAFARSPIFRIMPLKMKPWIG